MKICLYLENPKYYKGCGIEKAYQHQEKALKYAKVNYTMDSNSNFDAILVNSTWFKSYLEIIKAKKNGKKVAIYTHMTTEDFKNSFFGSNFLSFFLRKWLNFLYSKADLLIAPSPYTKNLLKERYSNLRNQNIVSLSNGISIEEWKNSESKAKIFKKFYNLKKPIVLGIGMVFKRKGIIDFIKVARKTPEADFVWIGKYNKVAYNSEMRKEMKNAPKNFHYIGYVPDIKGAYSASQIFFFPSFEENEGIVVLEAAAMSKPLVLRDIPVFSSYLKNKFNYIKGKNNDEFGKIIKDLLNNKKSREFLGKNARKIAEERDLKKIGLKLKKIFETLLKNEKR